MRSAPLSFFVDGVHFVSLRLTPPKPLQVVAIDTKTEFRKEVPISDLGCVWNGKNARFDNQIFQYSL